MTDSNNNESDASIRAVVRSLLETLADMDAQDRAMRRKNRQARIGRTPVGHEFSIDVGTLDSASDSDKHEPEAEVTNSDYVVSVRYSDDEVVAVADLPDIDPDELSAGIDQETAELAIGKGDTVIKRVSLRHGNLAITDAAFNNGILELRLYPEEGSVSE